MFLRNVMEVKPASKEFVWNPRSIVYKIEDAEATQKAFERTPKFTPTHKRGSQNTRRKKSVEWKRARQNSYMATGRLVFELKQRQKMIFQPHTLFAFCWLQLERAVLPCTEQMFAPPNNRPWCVIRPQEIMEACALHYQITSGACERFFRAHEQVRDLQKYELVIKKLGPAVQDPMFPFPEHMNTLGRHLAQRASWKCGRCPGFKVCMCEEEKEES